MHRSGTSLLGGVLQRLGISLPGETIVGDTHNPLGYFEWDSIVSIQERLLIDLHRWWPSRDGTLPMPQHWLEHPATKAARRQLLELLDIEASRQSSLFAIKDPRSSRLLPLWLDITRELGIPLHLFLAVRDPAEVTASLVKRDGPLVGMNTNRAQQLWWRHNLEVVTIARQHVLPLTIVDFGRWFDNPQLQLDKVIDGLPGLEPSQEQKVDALSLIDPNYRRSLSNSVVSDMHDSVCHLYGQLSRPILPRRLPAETPPRALLLESSSVDISALLTDPHNWSSWLDHHRNFPAPRPYHLSALTSDPCIYVCGPSWMDLVSHLWLQRAPLPDLDIRSIDSSRSEPHCLRLIPSALGTGSLQSLSLNLELPTPERASHWLSHLRLQQLVLDPDPARVLLLRALGLPAWWLDLHNHSNGWLQQSFAVDPLTWANLLGLPAPNSGDLIVLGSAGASFEESLAAEASNEMSSPPQQPPISYFPGWPDLLIKDPATGLARAGWLQAASSSSARLVHTFDDHNFQLLDCHVSHKQLPTNTSPAELRCLHFDQPIYALAEDRSQPIIDDCWTWQNEASKGEMPSAAVVVSLFNYSDRIIDALESVYCQQQSGLELIVVDDASSDDGFDVVHSWMKSRCLLSDNTLVSMQLFRHASNSGLAVARNTAFAASRAPWCFVLDADNFLFPRAVQTCLSLVQPYDDNLAVVHPLLSVKLQSGRDDECCNLLSPHSWQRDRFCFGNHVDAMALVRRNAWESVGGYTHIEGGWEDFDFWCKLVGAGYYGLQCPHILAVYRSHTESMSSLTTNHRWQALSRTLQQRHPWLNLPLATDW